MPLFRGKKRGGGGEPKPPDADQVIERALKALGREYDMRGDTVDIKLAHGWEGYNLEALRRRMQARPHDTWLGIATKDLRETVELAEREGPLPEWEEAKTRLKLRMHLKANVPPAYPLGVAFGDDLIAVLSLDKGDKANLLKLVDANHWGLPFEDLLHVARINTQKEQDLERQRITLKDDAGEAAIVSSKRWFAASQVLWPELMLGEIGRFGAVVAAPNAHVALAYAIDDRRALAALELLEPWAQRRTEAGVPAISPYLYWWRPGNVVKLDAVQRAELEALLPPDEPPPPPAPSRVSSTRPR